MSLSGFGRTFVLAALTAAGLGIAAGWFIAATPTGHDAFERLAGEIGCTCGTCPLRPIATCGCGFADGMLNELQVMLDDGLDDQAVVAQFVARYDERIRIKPATSGLDLTAWAAPMVLLLVGGVVVAGILARWSGEVAAADELATGTGPADLEGAAGQPDDDALRRRVERELAELDD